MFKADDLATSCKNSVNVGPVTRELRGAKMYTLLSISSFTTSAWRRHW